MRCRINCKFCGFSLRYLRIGKFGETSVVCCEWCEMLIVHYGPCVALAQCMQCGIILDGSPFQRRIFTTPDGKPDLDVGHSHGVCVPCGIIILTEHFQRKRLKKAVQEALSSPVLQMV